MPTTPTPEDYLASLLTTPKQEAEHLRASRSRQRILALGDALRHIGNIYNTNQGAVLQQFNDPVTIESQRYKQDKLLRDANNMKYYTYQQAKQAQDAKQKQWEADFALKLGTAEANRAYQQANLKERERVNNLNIDIKNRTLEANKDRWKRQDEENTRHHGVMEKQGQQRIGLQSMRTKAYVDRVNGGAGGGQFTLPTMEGYVTFGKDFNANKIGKKALYDKFTPYLTPQQQQSLASPWVTPEQKSAIINTGIAQWLIKDPDAAAYMEQHHGAKRHKTVDDLDLGLVGDEEDDGIDLELEQ